jgi:integrase
LRFFFVKTLKRRYVLEDTPYPKAPRRLPQILNIEEAARVIDAADSLSHRTMLMVLYSTGMRNAGPRHLQVADIDSRGMLIHVPRGKGGRDRYVPLSPTLLTTLRVYYRGGCDRRCGCFLEPSAAGAPTSPLRPRSSGMRVSSRPVAPGSASGARRT